jgi:uncharacterized protein
MNNQLINKIAAYVKNKMHDEKSGGDWFHVERVWQMAKRLQAKEGGDLFIIELGALLHVLRQYHNPVYEETKGQLILESIMDILEVDEALRPQLFEIIVDCKYHGDDTTPAKTLEGRILQDANWLDSLGAIGIARTFATGGKIGRALYDPKISVRTQLSKQAFQREKKFSTSFNYLYEKSMQVAKILNTKTAKSIAKERIAYLESFIKEFIRENDEGKNGK